MANGWKPGGDIIGAGHRDYAEGVMSKWDDFTEGKYPIPDLTAVDEFEVYGDSGNIGDLQYNIKNGIEGFVTGKAWNY